MSLRTEWSRPVHTRADWHRTEKTRAVEQTSTAQSKPVWSRAEQTTADHQAVQQASFFTALKKKDFIYLFLERGQRSEGEKHQCER